MLLLELNVGKPWLHTTGITQQILFINRVLISLCTRKSAQSTKPSFNQHIRSGKSPAGTQMFDPSVRAAGVISGAEVSLALRHSVRAGSNHTGQQVSMEE